MDFLKLDSAAVQVGDNAIYHNLSKRCRKIRDSSESLLRMIRAPERIIEGPFVRGSAPQLDLSVCKTRKIRGDLR